MSTPPTPTNPVPLHLQTSTPYNAYNGEEYLLWIMKRIHEDLKRYGHFSLALTYERAEFDFQLKLTSYALEDRIIKGEHKLLPKPPVTEILTVSSKAPAPDDLRRNIGATVPSPQLTSGGMVDVALDQQKK